MHSSHHPGSAQSRRLTYLCMQTRFYDSAEPGPPHGWLDADQEVSPTKRPIWENAITVIQQAARHLAGSMRGGDVSSQIWGGLHAGGCWWIYHVIPAGEDRFGRPGRTLTVLFCSQNKEGFDWETISIVAPEMEALAKNRNHMVSLLRRIHRSQPIASYTDDILKLPSTPLHEALKSEMGCLLDGLGEGHHEYFTISGNGTISNRGQESISPKALPPQPTPKPTSETTLPKASVRKLQPVKPPLMKPSISHALVLGIGLLVGVGLHWVLSPKATIEKPHKNQLIFRSDDEAIFHLRAATDYLEQSTGRRRESLSPGKPQIQPQRRSSTP